MRPSYSDIPATVFGVVCYLRTRPCIANAMMPKLRGLLLVIFLTEFVLYALQWGKNRFAYKPPWSSKATIIFPTDISDENNIYSNHCSHTIIRWLTLYHSSPPKLRGVAANHVRPRPVVGCMIVTLYAVRMLGCILSGFLSISGIQEGLRVVDKASLCYLRITSIGSKFKQTYGRHDLLVLL